MVDPDITLDPIDLGFDPRAHSMPCVIHPTMKTARYELNGQNLNTAASDFDGMVRELAEAGYDLIVDQAPNGRNIEFCRKRMKYAVQPHDDNYVIFTETLEQAQEAYLHPEKYRR
jgi:hypothetical protein